MKGKALEQRSRLKALHLRWHVKRNLVIPTCTFCQLPTVKNLPDPAIQVKSPASTLQEEHEKQIKALEDQEKRDAFKDKVWKAALAGLSISEACEFLRMEVQLLLPIVKQDFNTEWQGLLELARITTRCDLSSAAIKGARNGDTRLLIRLMDEGFFISINGSGVAGADTFSNGLRQMTVEQLKAKRAELARVADRGVIIEDSAFTKNHNGTLEIRDSIPEEITKFEAQGNLEVSPIPVFEAANSVRPDLPVEDNEAAAIREIERTLAKDPWGNSL